ncbi:MAG: hypothetical protein NZ853_11025 [Leptospiraceae bacterium]|nr:hypothetical protein [Leptospiraceae bacterium]MDW7975510.1 hypothetical protein [Leptospiraceae bacterium]
MSFYIIDILPYLKGEAILNIEKLLGMVLRNTSKKEELQKQLKSILKRKFLPIFKEHLLSDKNHITKQIFLEGGFLLKEEGWEISEIDFPLIEFHDYIYLPLEFYEIILEDGFFLKNHFLIGALKKVPKRELFFWKTWLEKETQIQFYHETQEKYLLKFYFYVLLSPINLPFITLKKRIYSLEEVFREYLNKHPLLLWNENFYFYQALTKLNLYYGDSFVYFENTKLKLKELLLLFLTGKLIPIFEKGKIQHLVATRELRDIEISTYTPSDNVKSLYQINIKI